MSDAIRWYDANAEDVSRRYKSVAAEIVHGWLVDMLPSAATASHCARRRIG